MSYKKLEDIIANISYIRLLGRNTNRLSYIENIHNNRISAVYIFFYLTHYSLYGKRTISLHRMVYTLYVNHPHPDTGERKHPNTITLKTHTPSIVKPTHHHRHPHTTPHLVHSDNPATTPRPHHAPPETPAQTAPADPGWLTAQPQTDSARHGPRRAQNSPHHPHSPPRRRERRGEAGRGKQRNRDGRECRHLERNPRDDVESQVALGRGGVRQGKERLPLSYEQLRRVMPFHRFIFPVATEQACCLPFSHRPSRPCIPLSSLFATDSIRLAHTTPCTGLHICFPKLHLLPVL